MKRFDALKSQIYKKKSIMKREILINPDKLHVCVQVWASATLLAPGVAGEETQDAANAEKLRVHAKLVRSGVTGAYILKEGEQEENPFYLIEDGVIKFAMPNLPFGYNRLTVALQYGTNEPSVLVADINVPADAGDDEFYVHDEYEFDAVKTVGGAGGGADYKTDVYMDGDGRVIVERLEDGSTVILDSHENPILRRSADGTTTYYDAYQSARLLMSEHGDVSINYNEAGTVKTMQLAEAILSRTTKHLLTYNGTNIKEGATVMTHAALYEMMMSTPAFVVLVYNDHAYHPNLVTASQIAFTCSYFSTNDEIVVERVNITSANVITTSTGKTSAGGLALNTYKGLAFGSNSTANAENAFAHGSGCKATKLCSHAEGSSTTAAANNAHAEGSGCGARGIASHAEGSSCEAYGDGSHAEGLSTLANEYHSHAEGYSTKAAGLYSHAQGIHNNSDDADTQGAFSHGCGTVTQKKNAFTIIGSQVYMLGVGGYDGTNHRAQGVMSVQQVLAAMLNPEAMTLGMDDDDAPIPTYKDKDVHEWTAKDLADYNRDLLAEWAEEEAKRKAEEEAKRKAEAEAKAKD